MKTEIMRWGAMWHSKNRLDGLREHILFTDDCKPALFHTKAEAMSYIKLKYGYIAKRQDLREEPHGWRVPKPVKLKISFKVIK